MLVSSRLGALGQYTPTTSNGSDTTSNSRLATWNESRAVVTKLRIIYPNWEMGNGAEEACPNAITITGSFEYPAGNFNQVTWSSATSTSLSSGNLFSDIITLSVPWAIDDQAWVRTFISVTGGQSWCTGNQQNTATGEAVDSGIGLSDKTMGGTITNNASVSGYGPAAVVGVAWAGTPLPFALAVIGDSNTTGDSQDDRGNNQAFGRAAGWDNLVSKGKKVPFLNLGEGGQSGSNNSTFASAANRIDLMQKAGITHSFVLYGSNDLVAGATSSQVEGSLTSIMDMLKFAGPLSVLTTLPPRSTSTDGWITVTNQTAISSGWVGNPPPYATVNSFIKSKPSPMFDFVDAAAGVESSPNSGLWSAGGGSTTSRLTTDGAHWQISNTNPEAGGIFIVRDIIIPKISTWCRC